MTSPRTSSPLSSTPLSHKTASTTLPTSSYVEDPEVSMTLLQILPPLITPETIQHIGQTPHPYPVYRGTTVCRPSFWLPHCPPGTKGHFDHDHAKCIPAIEAAFQPREIEYVIVPWPREMNIISPWLEKRGLGFDIPFHDQHAVSYRGRKKPFHRLVQFGGEGLMNEEFRLKCLPTEEKIREVLEDIEMEKENERRGVWTRENYADVYSDPDPIPGP
ncbi:MAG: hypothetical protein M1822_008364 [Bathelium mastoideum]|nr:MAG: hypothetical protein M1822_008364 [Bathelium mastoideum]